MKRILFQKSKSFLPSWPKRVSRDLFFVGPCLYFFIGFVWTPYLSGSVWAFQEKESVWHWVQNPSVKYEREEKDLFQIFKESEIVFMGRIKDIVVTNVGLMHAPVQITRLVFKDVEPIKGKVPDAETFQYPKHSRNFQFEKNAKVLIALKKMGNRSSEYYIYHIADASKGHQSLAREASS